MDRGNIGLGALDGTPVREDLVRPMDKAARQGHGRGGEGERAAGRETDQQAPRGGRLEERDHDRQRQAEVRLDPDQRQGQPARHRLPPRRQVPGGGEAEEHQRTHLTLEDVEEGDGREGCDRDREPPA